MSDRPRRLLLEAVASARSRPILTGLLVIVATLALWLPSQFERNAAVAALDYEHGLNQRGYSTLLLSASRPPRDVPTDVTCEQMSGVEGVEAAVWLVGIPPGTLFTAAGPNVPLWFAGGDVQRLVAEPRSEPVEVVIDEGLGVVATDTMQVFDSDDVWADRPVRAAVGDLGRFGAGFSGNVLVVAPAIGQRVDHCIVLTSTEHRASVAATAAALFQDPGSLITSWALLNADDLESPAERFHERAARWYWLWGLGAALLAWLGALRLTRSDRALYAVLNLAPRHIWVILAAQWFILVTVAAVVSLAIVRTRGGEPDLATTVELETWLRTLIALNLGGGVLGAAMATPTDLYAVLRNE